MTTLATFTVGQYQKMVDAGVFYPPEENRVELIRGEIQTMPPIGTNHCDAVDLFAKWGHRMLPMDEVRVRAAIEAGEFDHLPGLGKKLAVLDEPYDENWWLRRKLRAERIDLLMTQPGKPTRST